MKTAARHTISLICSALAFFAASTDLSAALGDQVRLLQEAKNHWAFQPIPAGNPHDTNAIDQLVRAKLASRSLKPAQPAEPRILVRRLFFDLIGLPPSFAESEKWTRDWSPAKFPQLVEHLLASPHYGERWGRHWLDVARYADTMGHMGGGTENRYPFAYTYRDWVIQALNEDLPYDEFLKRQIAADLMIAKGLARTNDLAALGFLTVGSRFSGKNDIVLDDRIDVVTRGTLGLTVSCARCHDHMFDPIPTADYYSLYGVFANSTEPDELPVLPGDRRDPKAAAAFDLEFAKRQGEVDKFLTDHHNALRSAEKIAAYLKLVVDTTGFERSKALSEAGKRDLFLRVAQRWEAGLKVAKESRLAVFIPWHAAAPLFHQNEDAKALEALSAALADTNTNPLVAKALRDGAPKTLDDLCRIYGVVLAESDADNPHTDKAREELRQILRHPAGPTGFEVEQTRHYLNRANSDRYRKLVAKVDRLIVESPGAPARAMIVQDVSKPGASYIFKRGDPRNRGEKVPRQFLGILEPDRKPFTPTGSGRLELAERISTPNNPLTARVIANRVWLHHFGEPLVATPSDFGLQAPKPVQLDVLDWLASYLIQNNWSLKQLHRVILHSATWQQSAIAAPSNGDRDPANAFLTRAERRRMGYESTRDALLSVTGELDTRFGGRPDPLEGTKATKRRAVYGFIDRYDVAPMLRTFDFADPNLHAPQRPETTVPQQALFFMNSPFVEDRARELVRQISAAAPAERVRQLYQRIYARPPGSAESTAAIAFAESDPKTGWQNLAQALLAANEFTFVD
jgi:hypothetical protein